MRDTLQHRRNANSTAVLVVAAIVCSMLVAGAGEAAPILYAQPAHSSPVRGEPDDLLMIPGNGLASRDTVVYRAISDTTQPLSAPHAVPAASDEHTGVAPIVSAANVPLSLTVRLPRVMRADQTYALWVRTRDGTWSNGVLINDARPLWISPSYLFATQRVARLPRYLKVVGRNLQSAPGSATRVALIGPESVEIAAVVSANSPALDRYVARIALPERLRAGEYEVRVNRDGRSWVTVPGQRLVVRDDPAPAEVFEVGDAAFGLCRANDELDDTACIHLALVAAARAGRGTVHLSAGRWIVTDRANSRSGGNDGVVVARGVDVRGAGADLTTLVRTSVPDRKPTTPLLTILGQTTIEGIHFKDAVVYAPRDQRAPMLMLGQGAARIVEDVIITANRFDHAHPAVGGAGAPLQRLFVTYNEFGAYDFGLLVRGARSGEARFRIEDAVVTHNVFKPGSYLDSSIRQGAIASQLGGSHRFDFSNNLADGAAEDYLDAPGDARGWRAGFFWNLTGSNEMLLIAENFATCTGDRIGDGEAIALDNDGNTFGFGSARPVIDASAHSLTVDGALRARQSGRDVGADYYVGHYVQVVDGAGLGQTRRIEAYRSERAGSRVSFTISPAWDVLPDAESRVTVGRQFWQVLIVANVVDHRRPLCRKSNRTGPKGGVIGLWAQTADSVVEGNRQFDTDGILTNQKYSAEDPACATCASGTFVQSFIEIRGNSIAGEYDWDSDCSHSGIYIANSAAPVRNSAPPTMSYGVSIARNSITHADGLRGGAIVVPLTWHQGPPPHDWPLVSNLLIYQNRIADIAGPPPRRACDNPQLSRVGINLHQAGMVRAPVLYANSCNNVTTPLHDSARGTVRVCPAEVPDSCECRAQVARRPMPVAGR